MKPLHMGIMGLPKTGKTTFALSVFQSKQLDPTKVLYFDNHESTLGQVGLPKFDKKKLTGVKHAPLFSDIGETLVEIERKMARGDGSPFLDCIVLDDLTEQSALSIGHLSGESGMNMSKWGQHKLFMSSLYRSIKSVAKNTIFVLRCDWQGDPNQRPDNKTIGDQRDQKMQPILEGAFNGWLRYDVSLLVYSSKEVRSSGKAIFSVQLQPTEEIMVENRLWSNEPRKIESATFDTLLEILKEKEEGKEGN